MKANIKLFIFLFFAGGFVLTSCQEDLIKPEDYKVDINPAMTPDAVTNEPVKISAAYADLTGVTEVGTVDRGFVISEDSEFGTVTIVSSADTSINFSARAGALKPLTQYYYKAYSSTIEGGTKFGEVKTFNTREGVVAFSIRTEENTREEWEEAGFTTIDKDGDGNNWTLFWYDEDEEQAAYRSFSWLGDPLTPENYLVFPEIILDGIDGALTVWFQSLDEDWAAEHFKVVIHNEPITEDNVGDLEVIYQHTMSGGAIYSTTVDIPEAYEGGSIYLAIVHSETSDEYALAFLGAIFSYAK